MYISKIIKENNIRLNLDERDEKLGYKLRESTIKKIPYTLIIGDREKENNNISYRKHGQKETITVSKEEFVNFINDKINKKEINY